MISVSEKRRTAEADRDWHPMQADHRALRASAERLDEMLGRLAAGASAAEAEARSLLEEFRLRLLAHLDAEEQNGILERAAEAEPRFARRIEKLRLEHDVLRQDVVALAAGPAPRAAGADWDGFHARFVAFRRVLLAHEEAENDVLHGAYMEDVGGRG